jgi:uncharacterized protein (TIRG00374 family)
MSEGPLLHKQVKEMHRGNGLVESDLIKNGRSPYSKKRLILTLAKCLVSGFLIFWILRGTNLREIWMALWSANKPLLLLAFSLSLLTIYLRALRWQALLKSKQVNAPISFLIKSILVGIFFDNLMPSIIGGDLVRTFDSWRLANRKADAIAVIIVDRMLGVLALILFALVALIYYSRTMAVLSAFFKWVILAAGVVILALWVIFMAPSRITGLIDKIRFPFSKKIQNAFDKMTNALISFSGYKNILTRGFILSLILQASVVTTFFIIGKSLNIQAPFNSYFLIIPLAFFVMMVPISINAIGIRENVYVFLFSIFYASKPEAIAFAWISFGFIIIRGLIGAIVYAFRNNIDTPWS